MSHRPVSQWRRLAAVALIALTVGLSLGPVLHAGVGHDTDCDPVLFVHDASQHRITSPPDEDRLPSGEHCIVCHLFRTSRESQTAQSIDARDPAACRTALPAETFVLSEAAILPLPARAPPLS